MSLRRLLIALCVLFAPPMVITSGPRIVEIDHEEVAVALDLQAFLRRVAVDQPPPPSPPRGRARPRHRSHRRSGHRVAHRRPAARRPLRHARRTFPDATDGDDDDDEQA